MMAQVSDPPPPMLSVAPDLVLPLGLEAVVMRCLAKNPDLRWRSMEDLVTALQLRPDAITAEPAPALAAAPNVAPPVRGNVAASPHRGKARGPLLALAACGAVVVALTGAALLRRPHDAAAPAASAAPPPPAPPPPKATATLHVETDPVGAKVNEEGELMCAPTPCDVVYVGEAAEPASEHLLAFLLPGYKLERKVARVTDSPVIVRLTKAR